MQLLILLTANTLIFTIMNSIAAEHRRPTMRVAHFVRCAIADNQLASTTRCPRVSVSSEIMDLLFRPYYDVQVVGFTKKNIITPISNRK